MRMTNMGSRTTPGGRSIATINSVEIIRMLLWRLASGELFGKDPFQVRETFFQRANYQNLPKKFAQLTRYYFFSLWTR